MLDYFNKYISSIASKFSYEETSEMGYRSDFEELLKQIFSNINNTHVFHDAKSQQGNKPDFIVLKDKIPLVYLEVKNIGTSLDKIEKSEQMSRYYGYTNLVLSDYREFRFYRNGIPYGEPIKIADYNIKNREIISIDENFEYLAKTLVEFTQSYKEPIKSAAHLAKIMGGKAQRIRGNVRDFLSYDSEKNLELERIYETIKKLLVHDLSEEAFADMYAQTLVYGLFAARYYDKSPESFTRQEARDLIPATNPFLRHFFDHIIGPDFDKRLEYIVNELCEVFSHADVQELMKQYFKIDLWGLQTGQDPVIHFYEDFLKEYDPELRKKMGAYYTPIPVVNFIIKSVDDLLKKEFNLPAGLADTTKLTNGFHKVQVLDPATGTGTFISVLIKFIYESIVKNGQKGRWPMYVHYDLLPRIYGFELMMAPYTISHLKIGITLRQEGLRDYNQRLGIYLTNSLEKSDTQQQNLFSLGLADSIAEESKQASEIKNEKPIMIIVGNPPYSVSSSNKGKWIMGLIEDYKKNLGEQKTNLDDDYIKFIRLAEHFIEKNRTGIVAMITNNSFIDGVTHRQMRKHLLETFDDIYILNLHGSAEKETYIHAVEKDENVFAIKQGVSISIFVRNKTDTKKLAKVYYTDIFGKQKVKFEKLNTNDISTLKWKVLNYSEPYYFFVPKDFSELGTYSEFIKISDLFVAKATGIKNERDAICIDFNKKGLEKRILDFAELSEGELKNIYHLKDSRDWKVSSAKYDIRQHLGANLYRNVVYRPFDVRWTYYTGTSRGFIGTPNAKGMNQMIKNNLLLVFTRLNRQKSTNYYFVSNLFVDIHLLDSAGDSLSTAPLYLYNESGSRESNLKKEILDKIEKFIGKVSPENMLDYVYAVLSSPKYQEKYKEYLKIDFPRVPYPKDRKSFDKLVKFGTELRLLHLLESPIVNKFITTYPVTGLDKVEKVEYKDGNVYINEEQYFGNVSEVAWNFWIGGYQPAQKWLKDRKGRTLTNEDIEHYQKMIVALSETGKIMKQIDKIIKL